MSTGFLRPTLRRWRRRPLANGLAILVLGLGLGGNTAIWTLADTVLWRSTPFERPDELVVLWRTTPDLERSSLSWPTYLDWKARNRSFEPLSAILAREHNLAGSGGALPERLAASWVSGDFFVATGIRPALGRPLGEDDDRPTAEPAVVLGFELWMRRFGGRSDILGTTLDIDRRAYTVVGVLPQGAADEIIAGNPVGDLVLPIGPHLDRIATHERAIREGLYPVGRLRPGVEIESARSDLSRLAAELADENPLTMSGNEAEMARLVDDRVGRLSEGLFALAAAVLVILALATVNLVQLQRAHLVERRRELATRVALGAGRIQLLRQLLSESLLLGLVGGATGLGVAAAILRVAPRLGHAVPSVAPVPGPAVLLASLLLALLVSAAIGLGPALAAIRDPAAGGALGRSVARLGWRRPALLAGEIAAALVLLIGAGLLTESYANLLQVRLGFVPDDLILARTSLPVETYGDDDAWLRYQSEALEIARSVPGIARASITGFVPLGPWGGGSRLLAGDRPVPSVPDMDVTWYHAASADYFEQLRIPLLEGRSFTSEEEAGRGARVAVISETIAEHYWPGESALGRRIAFELDGTPASFEPLYREVVGVVGSFAQERLGQDPEHHVVVPYGQMPHYDRGQAPSMTFLLEPVAGTEAGAVVESLRQALSALDPGVPLHGVRPVGDLVDRQLEEPRALLALLGGFALLALLLAVVGVFSIFSLLVSSRRTELGLRMALGATPSRLVLRLLGLATVAVASGLLAGIAISLGTTRVLRGYLVGVEPVEPATCVVAALLLAATAFAAILGPALRSARTDPARLLLRGGQDGL